MNLTISKYNPKRNNIENMVKRTNLAAEKINHTVWVIESTPDLLAHMNEEKAIVADLNTKIDKEKEIIARYRKEIDTYEGRLGKCGLLDRHAKRFFKKEISKLLVKIRLHEDNIQELQRKFNAHYSNFYKYRKHLPSPQDVEKATSDHKKIVAYEYNPQVRLLNLMTGGNIPTADPNEIKEVPTISLSIFENDGISVNSVYQVSIDQSNTQEEME